MSDQSQWGNALRRLRKKAGLSGVDAAHLSGLSQSTISRAENGIRLLTLDQVEILCRIYHVDASDRREVRQLTRQVLAEESHPRTALHPSTWRIQYRIKKLEKESSETRNFEPAIIPGLIQTGDYIRALYGDSQSRKETDRAVTLRLERQQLINSQRSFTLLMAEGALRWQMGSPSIMITQLERLTELTFQPNIRLGIIPWTTPTNLPAHHGFTILDSQVVLVSTQTSIGFLSEPDEIAEYEELFTEFESLAVFDEQARAVFHKSISDYRTLI